MIFLKRYSTCCYQLRRGHLNDFNDVAGTQSLSLAGTLLRNTGLYDLFHQALPSARTAPGTLVEQQDHTKIALTLSLMDYTEAELTEKTIDSFADCVPYLQRESITWIHAQGEPGSRQSAGPG